MVERLRDELGDWRIGVLSPRGGRIHAPWAMAAAATVREETGGRRRDALGILHRAFALTSKPLYTVPFLSENVTNVSVAGPISLGFTLYIVVNSPPPGREPRIGQQRDACMLLDGLKVFIYTIFCYENDNRH